MLYPSSSTSGEFCKRKELKSVFITDAVVFFDSLNEIAINVVGLNCHALRSIIRLLKKMYLHICPNQSPRRSHLQPRWSFSVTEQIKTQL